MMKTDTWNTHANSNANESSAIERLSVSRYGSRISTSRYKVRVSSVAVASRPDVASLIALAEVMLGTAEWVAEALPSTESAAGAAKVRNGHQAASWTKSAG